MNYKPAYNVYWPAERCLGIRALFYNICLCFGQSGSLGLAVELNLSLSQNTPIS